MKKIIAIISLIVLMVCGTSCINESNNGSWTSTRNGCTTLKLVDVEFNGETHQYVFFAQPEVGSLSHWAGCKYCKEHQEHKD